MLLCGGDVLALEVQVGHVVLSHRRSVALRQFGHRSTCVTCIEHRTGQGLSVGLVAGLQLDRLAQMLLGRHQIPCLGIEFAEFHAGIRIGRCCRNRLLIELDRLGRILLAIIQTGHIQERHGVLGLGFQSSRVAVERLGIVALRLKVVPLGNEYFWSNTQWICPRFAFPFGRRHRRSRCGSKGSRNGRLGLAIGGRNRRTDRSDLVLDRLPGAGQRRAH